GARNHSIFLDVQLWDRDDGSREGGQALRWSCAFLASVWQLLRLGLLRHEGRSVVVPAEWTEKFSGSTVELRDVPDHWDLLPPIVKLNPTANPFSAYQTVSILSSDYLPVEAAVRTILSQVRVDPAAARQVVERSSREGMALPRELVERISYV